MSKLHKGYSHTTLGQIHFRQCRQVEGTPLVLLHQTASSGLMFEPLMGHLAADFPTIAPDTPGFGNSFTPDSFTMGELAAALHTALSDMGLEQCYLFGHHTGAALAVQMAYDYPKLARWLVLSGPPLLSPEQVAGLQAGLKPFALLAEGEHLLGTWQRIRQRDPSLPLEVVQRELLLNQMAGAAAGPDLSRRFRPTVRRATGGPGHPHPGTFRRTRHPAPQPRTRLPSAPPGPHGHHPRRRPLPLRHTSTGGGGVGAGVCGGG
ncbi:MAG: alpha/beta fold hydrolase [Chloroflexi bacterium]|nr:alpha/beta fold hydrolase [Chloroflexota bacterium]